MSAQIAMGQFESAIESCQRSMAAGDWWMAHLLLVAAYPQAGRSREADLERTIVESFMHRFTIADFEAMQLSDNPQYAQQTETYLYPGYEGLASLSN